MGYWDGWWVRSPIYSAKERAQIEAILEFNDLYAAYLRDIEHVLYEFGLARPDITIFRHVCRGGRGVTSSWIEWKYEIDPGRLSRCLKLLEAHELVALSRRAPDRRYLHIELTERGERLRKQVDGVAEAIAARLLRRLGGEDRRVLVVAIETLSGILRHRKRLPPEHDLVPHPLSRLRRAD